MLDDGGVSLEVGHNVIGGEHLADLLLAEDVIDQHLPLLVGGRFGLVRHVPV